MDGDAGGGSLAAASPHAEEAIAAVRDDARFPAQSDEEDYDDLYGDVNVGLLPLLPRSPSPAPTSPPKTPSPGRSPSPSPPPRHAPAPEPQPQREPEPEPETKPATPPHQPPRPPPAQVQHVPHPQRAPRGGDASSSSPPSCTALYISGLHWWTTDAEVETALGAHAAAALYGLLFDADKLTGKSRGSCRADFLHPAAAASAAAALHGRAFHGRHCVASLSRPPALHRLGDDSDTYAEAAKAPNPTRGRGNGARGRGASDATTARGNVGPALGDRPIPAPPLQSMAPLPRGPPFGGVMGGVGGFQSMGQYNAGMGICMMPSAVAPHVNPAFLVGGGMAMRGPGMWHDQGMNGGLWGARQQWNSRGCQMPWQQLTSPAQQHRPQQQFGNGDYVKGRGKRRERPGSKSEERSIGNVMSYPDRRQSDRAGGDWHKEHDREEKGWHRERVLEKEREHERHWDERDRFGGDKKRYQEYTERDDFETRGRASSRSQSRDGGGDHHHPRRWR